MNAQSMLRHAPKGIAVTRFHAPRSEDRILEADKAVRVLHFAICAFAAATGLAMTTRAEGISIEVDRERLTYRVCLVSGNALEYDSLDFEIPSRRLAPRGAKADVRDEKGVSVTAGRLFSSYEFSSQIPIPNERFVPFSDAGTFCSEWYRLSDLIRGLDRVSQVSPDLWADMHVEFSVAVRTASGGVQRIRGRSDVITVTPELRSRAGFSGE